MQGFSRFLASLFLAACLVWPACAEKPGKVHGLAMHGAPKYGPGFTHLDYANPDARQGGVLNQAALGSFDTLNPFNIKGEPVQGLGMVYERLMARVWDEPFSLYGLIAHAVELPADRSAITFHIDPKARFHDGHSVTASDVAFSLEILKEHGSPYRRRIYELVANVVIISPHEIRFEFGPGHDRETAMIMAIMPVLPEHYWGGADRDFGATTLKPPLGSGPYRITAVEAGRRIVYQKVPDYWGAELPVRRGHHNFKRVVYTYFRDQDVARQAFLAGETGLWRESDPSAWRHMRAEKRRGLVFKAFDHGRPLPAWFFAFNTRRSPLDVHGVREALVLAFDGEWPQRAIYQSAARRVRSYYPNSRLAAPDASALWPMPEAERRTRLRRASRLLHEAGFEIRNNRLVSPETGKAVVFELLVNSAEAEKLAVAYRRNLETLGIGLKIQRADSAVYQGRLEGFDYDLVSYQWDTTLSPGTEQKLYFGSQAADTPGSRNYAGIRDPQVDRLIEKLVRTKSYQALTTTMHKLDRALISGYYGTPLYYFPDDRLAFQDSLRHPAVTPVYGPVLETWWSEKD